MISKNEKLKLCPLDILSWFVSHKAYLIREPFILEMMLQSQSTIQLEHTIQLE